MSRDIDALVAEKVMGIRMATRKFKRGGKGTIYPKKIWYRTGYQWQHKDGTLVFYPGGGEFGWGWSGTKPAPPAYSTDIAAAFGIVALMGDHDFGLDHLLHSKSKNKWRAWFGNEGFAAFAPTAPLAICLAALKAVGVNPPEAKK